MAKMVFILTDTSQRYFDPNDKEAVEVVQTANIPANDLDEYSPFALYYQEGLVCKGGCANSGCLYGICYQNFCKCLKVQ